MKLNAQRVRRKVVWGAGMALGILLSAVQFGGCGKAVRQGEGPAYLVLEQLLAASGAVPDEFGNVVSSDVLTFVKVEAARVPTIFEDPGRARFRVAMKDIGATESAAAPSANNLITITRYRVTFIRADGRNTPGVDVPYPFDGAITHVATGTATTAGFTLVRAAAKAEAPLLALVGGGGARFLSTIAEVTFYGYDAAGNAVSVSGRLSVNFADWGDPE